MGCGVMLGANNIVRMCGEPKPIRGTRILRVVTGETPVLLASLTRHRRFLRMNFAIAPVVGRKILQGNSFQVGMEVSL